MKKLIFSLVISCACAASGLAGDCYIDKSHLCSDLDEPCQPFGQCAVLNAPCGTWKEGYENTYYSEPEGGHDEGLSEGGYDTGETSCGRTGSCICEYSGVDDILFCSQSVVNTSPLDVPNYAAYGQPCY